MSTASDLYLNPILWLMMKMNKKSILISFKKKIIEQKMYTLNRENTTIVYRQGESGAMLLCFKSKRLFIRPIKSAMHIYI